MQEKRDGSKEGGRKGGVTEVNLVCRYTEEELMPSLIEYYSLKLPNPQPPSCNPDSDDRV